MALNCFLSNPLIFPSSMRVVMTGSSQDFKCLHEDFSWDVQRFLASL